MEEEKQAKSWNADDIAGRDRSYQGKLLVCATAVYTVVQLLTKEHEWREKERQRKRAKKRLDALEANKNEKQMLDKIELLATPEIA